MPERKLPCDDRTNGDSCQADDNVRQGNDLFMNIPSISTPLRLTGGGNTSFQSQENDKIEDQGHGPVKNIPTIYSSPLRSAEWENNSLFDRESSVLLTPSIKGDNRSECWENAENLEHEDDGNPDVPIDNTISSSGNSNENNILSFLDQDSSLSEQDIRDVLFEAGYAIDVIEAIIASKSEAELAESASKTSIEESPISKSLNSKSESGIDNANDILRKK